MSKYHFLVKFLVNLYQFLWNIVNAAISLLFISQWAVKTRIIENESEKIMEDQERNKFIDFLIIFWFADFSLKYCKCCHFFVIYRSVSCKNQDNREWIRKSHGRSRKINFIDFPVIFLFADFLFEKSLKCHRNQRQVWKRC